MSDQPDNPNDDDSTEAAPAAGVVSDNEQHPGEAIAPEGSSSAVAEPELLNPDDVQLADTSVSADAVEPVLGTSAEEVQLSEPSLGEAEISQDSADAASLEDVAAEAKAVAQEAEEVGTLVGGPRPAEDPADAAAPSGTAPVGGKAGDVDDASPDEEPAQVADSRDHEAVQDAGQHRDGGEQSVEGQDAEETPRDPEAAEEPPPGLTSYAASGEDPSWTGSAEDQDRWDALFKLGEAEAQGTEEQSETDGTVGTGSSETAGDESTGSGDGSTGQEAPASSVPVAPWEQPFAASHSQSAGSPQPPVGGAYGLPPVGAQQDQAVQGGSHAVDSGSKGTSRKTPIIIGVVGIIVLGLLIFGIIRIVDAVSGNDSNAGAALSASPGADGIIAENVSPLELAAGACVLDFNSDDVSSAVTTVICTTPHNAQLLATENYPDDAEYPGDAALNARGDELCNSAAIDPGAAAEYPELTLTQVTPTPGTWAEGDRRIDCFVVSSEGTTITDTLLEE